MRGGAFYADGRACDRDKPCVSRQLRPAAKLYRAMEEVKKPEEALRFLQAHPGSLTLSHARAALLESREEAAPVLLQTEGGFRLGG